MEVKGINQGTNTSIEVSKDFKRVTQTKNISSLEKVKSSNDNNKDNIEVDPNKLKDAIDKLNKFLEDNETHAEYEYHDKFKNNLMIKIVNNKTGETIREVPPKKILDMVAKMLEVVGVLFDKKA